MPGPRTRNAEKEDSDADVRSRNHGPLEMLWLAAWERDRHRVKQILLSIARL